MIHSGRVMDDINTFVAKLAADTWIAEFVASLCMIETARTTTVVVFDTWNVIDTDAGI